MRRKLSRISSPGGAADASEVDEVLEEGHKALVFSQFVSLLSIVRRPLDERKVPYEYLDGQTRDRQERVERFQKDPNCKLFLISLKAGGLGLNLTEANYVFLLDPWWNPAVEAQAIDRTHRIGQDRTVIAYRLLTRGTIEERGGVIPSDGSELHIPHARFHARLAGEGGPAELVEPVYLRAPDAERATA